MKNRRQPRRRKRRLQLNCEIMPAASWQRQKNLNVFFLRRDPAWFAPRFF